MPKKLYATGRSRQRAERAKRTQPRTVVTMQKPRPAPKPKPRPAPKPAPRPTRKPHGRTIPKDVTKRSPVVRKVPQRKRANVTTVTKPLPKHREIHPVLTRLGVTKRTGKKPTSKGGVSEFKSGVRKGLRGLKETVDNIAKEAEWFRKEAARDARKIKGSIKSVLRGEGLDGRKKK